MEVSLEWDATRICTRAYFIFGIHQWFRGSVTGKILKLADDAKLFRKTKEIGDKQKLQDYIDTLVIWSEKWQMLFHFGKSNQVYLYTAYFENDSGVFIV